MDIDFWKKRWHEGQTGFHRDNVNTCLLDYWSRLDIPRESSVFVPLCGKSLDMIWLASQGFNVRGVECSELAVQQFFTDNKIVFNEKTDDHFLVYSSENIEILCGDYFSLSQGYLSDIRAIYDRAALVALPQEMRQSYVELLARLAPDGVKILLVTLEYDSSEMMGPPFSVTHQEVMELYKDSFEISEINRVNILDQEPRFKQRGLDYLIESVYLIKKQTL